MEFESDTYRNIIREHYRKIGQRGGQVKGPTKRRGDSEYYRNIAKMRGKKKQEDVPP